MPLSKICAYLAHGNYRLMAQIFSLFYKVHFMKNQEKDKSRADQQNQPGIPAKNTEQLQGRSIVNTGSTTQGGSDHGQGSSQLGSQAYKQGEKKNTGANYDNEKENPDKNPDPRKTQQSGYSSEPERQETKKEQENMHNERNQNDLNADQQQNENTRQNESNK